MAFIHLLSLLRPAQGFARLLRPLRRCKRQKPRDDCPGASCRRAVIRCGGRRERRQKRKGSRRRPTLPRLHTAVPSALEGLTAGFGMDPGVSPPLWPPGTSPRFPRVIRHLCDTRMAGAKKERLRPRQISTGRLKRLHVLHLRPIYPVVSRVPYPLDAVSDLILRPASRLDAFSGYPFRT